MDSMIKIDSLSKTYAGGFQALKDINLEIKKGEIFALLGPNGAGKTTLISTICGITVPTTGHVWVGGYDIEKQFRQTRNLIGLVPQELTTDAFETVWDTVSFSRGLFGKKRDDAYIEKILRNLSLWEKRENKLMMLSGGMKRRVLIAKALSHEPEVLFLDEPTAGVDVELRKDMWEQVHNLRESGVTIILTTHYIEEAEEMSDRVGVINKGQIILVEKTADLMKNLGTKQLVLHFDKNLTEIPEVLQKFELQVQEGALRFAYDPKKDSHTLKELIQTASAGCGDFIDISTQQSSLEEIFVNIVREK